MLETNVNVREEYLRAMHLGQKEVKEAEAAGREPGPAVLDTGLPEIGRSAAQQTKRRPQPASSVKPAAADAAAGFPFPRPHAKPDCNLLRQTL